MPAPAIHCLALPTGLAVGDVNAYVIDADPLTLVDTGPPTPAALAALERGLQEHRRRMEDLELVVLTHQHIDHVGLAPLIAERSGAQVAAAAGLSSYLADLARAREEDIAVFSALMDRYGVPRDQTRRSLGAWRSRGSERRGTTVDLPLAAGDAVTIGDWAL
jgi:glyoxylase-like metal-dependent hydrolase (beta-lactamase superfamily II)